MVIPTDQVGDNGADCGEVCRYYKTCKKEVLNNSRGKVKDQVDAILALPETE